MAWLLQVPPIPPFCWAMTFTEPGALGQSELQVEGAMTFFGAPCEAGRDGASGMALLWQRSLSHSLSLTHSLYIYVQRDYKADMPTNFSGPTALDLLLRMEFRKKDPRTLNKTGNYKTIAFKRQGLRGKHDTHTHTQKKKKRRNRQ